MTFPQSILDLQADAQLAGTWTSITPYVYQRDQVAITRGHPDESSRATPQTGRFTINNRDGRFSPRNPTGPYYGQFGRNTPLRLSLPEGSAYLRMEDDTTSYVSCPDATGLHITGDVEIQIDTQLTDWTRTILASKFSAAGGYSWTLRIDDDGTARFFWSSTGANSGLVVNSTVPPPLGRIALKITLAVATGTVTFYTAPTIAGTWTQLGDAVVVGSTSVYASTSPLVVGANAELASSNLPAGFNHSVLKGTQGKIFAFKLLSGIGGTVVADPDFTAQTPGAASFADAAGNTWTLSGTAEISDRKYRFHGEATSWPQRWDVTGKDVYVPMQAAGILRRWQAPSAQPLNSAMYRAYTRITGSTAPVAYWPCEDGSAAVSIASGLAGGTPMAISGSPNLASDSSFACSAPLPVVNNSTWTGTVPAYTAPTGAANVMRFLLKVPSSSPPPDLSLIASMYTYGTVASVDLIYRTGSGLELRGYNSAGANLFATGAITGLITLDDLARVSVELQTSGSNVQYSIVTLAPGASLARDHTGTVAGSIGNVNRVTIDLNGDAGSCVIGHVSVQAVWDSLFELVGPLEAWSGEYAGIRFARLCGEENVPYRVYGYPADTVAMGAQTTQTLLNLLQECEDADRGLITESRAALALGYRTRASMFNQTATTLDYTASELSPDVLPTDDDQLTLNDVTVTRSSGGSSARQVQASGTLSTQLPPDGVGPYPTAVTINLAVDSQLGDEAGWILHLGTVDEPRYPSIPVNLARSELAALFYTLQDLDLGDRLAVDNPPLWLPPDPISQVVRGLTEVCFGYTFTIAWVCAPESPYRVAVFDDAVLGRADTDGSTLAAGATSTATSLSVATTDTSKPLWTTDAAEFPFDIVIAGERITVTNITGTSSPQTFTVTRSVNGVVKAQSSGADVRLFQPAILSM